MKRRNEDAIAPADPRSALKKAKLSEGSASTGSAPDTPESRIEALKAKLAAVKKQKEELHSISGTSSDPRPMPFLQKTNLSFVGLQRSWTSP